MSTPDVPFIRNPLGWAQVNLFGGWKRVWGVAAVYAAAMLTFSVIIFRASGVPSSSFAGSAIGIILFIQTVFLYLVACGQIKKCILRDFTTDMITSHRLSAMSGYTAVLGYITGPVSQVLAMTCVNWVACNLFMTMILPARGLAIAGPTMLLVVMLCLALTCWSLAVLMGLSTRGKSGIIGIIAMIGIAGNVSVIAIHPGLSLIVPLTSVSQIGAAAQTGIDSAKVFVGMAIQAILTLTFFVAAARKFHRDDVPAFTPILANILLAICTLTSAAAFKFWRPEVADLISPDMHFVVNPAHQMIAMLASLGLLGMLPIAASAHAEAAWMKRFAVDPVFAPRRPRPYYEAVMVATIIVLGIMGLVAGGRFKALMIGESNRLDSIQLIAIAVAFLLAMVAVSGVLRFCHGIGMNGLLPGILAVVLFWVVPILADIAASVFFDRHPTEGHTVLFTASPIGIWIAILKKLKAPIIAGLLAQGGIAVGCLLLAQRVRRMQNPTKQTA